MKWPSNSKRDAKQQSFEIQGVSTKSILETSALLRSLPTSPAPSEPMNALLVSPDDDLKQNKQGTFSIIDHVVSSEHGIVVNSPLNSPVECPREVRFSGIPDLFLSGSDEHFLENKVDDVNQQLQQALADLSAERVLRKQKEKNLVKLAKELNKRSADAALKERKLIQMSETVNSMHAALQQQRQIQCIDQHRYQTAVQESDEQAAFLKETSATLRSELKEAKLHLELLRSQLASHSGSNIIRYAVLSGLAILFAVVSVPTSGIVNATCAPIRPGSRFFPNPHRDQPDAFEAPWWAPHGTKETAFSWMCGGGAESRVRSKLQWNVDKLTISDASSSSILFQGRAAGGVLVGASTIRLQSSSKKIDEILAPWAL